MGVDINKWAEARMLRAFDTAQDVVDEVQKMLHQIQAGGEVDRALYHGKMTELRKLVNDAYATYEAPKT